MAEKYYGSGRSGAFEWYFQRVSGLALLVILLSHFFVLHYATEAPITYAKVMARLATPFWKAFDLTFLLLAVYHAINGLKGVLDDYVHVPTTRSISLAVLWIGGLGFLVLGALTIFSLKA